MEAQMSLDELRQFVPKFVNATTKEVGDELLRQARLLVRSNSGFGLLSLTPPKGLDEGQEIGNRSVLNDVQKVFVTKAALVGAMRKVSDRGTVIGFNRLIDNGEYEKAKDFLNGQKASRVQVKGYKAKRHGKVVNIRPYSQRKNVSALNIPRLGNIQAISQVPQASLHQMRRRKRGDSAGRVYKESYAQVVLRKPTLGQYIQDRQKRVGLLKAAWAKAATMAGLGVSIPQYIRRNLGRAEGVGRASFANPSNMFVELVNSFPVASSKIEKGDIEFLKQTRQESILKEMEHRMSKIAKAA
jgi:hypothetical protein